MVRQCVPEILLGERACPLDFHSPKDGEKNYCANLGELQILPGILATHEGLL
jgi:hypothetical protein